MSWPSSTRLMRSTGHCREPRDFCSGQRIKQAGILFPTIVEFVRVVWEQGTCVRGSDKWRCEQDEGRSQPWRSWRGDRSSSMERDSSRERGRYSGPRRSDRENWRHRSSDYREHQSYYGRKLNREYSKDRYDYNRRRRDDNRGRYRFDRRDSSEDRYSSRDRQTRSGVENRNARQKPPRARDNKERRAEDIRKEHASSDHSSDSSTKNE